MKVNNIVFLSAVLLLFATGAFSQQAECTADSIKSWLSFLASNEMKGRNNGSEEIEKVAAWLSTKYKQYGLKAVGDIKDFVQPYVIDNDTSFIHKNIIGYIPGKNENDNVIVLSAHFDHIGMSRQPVAGDSIYNGADDNASGIAVLLAIAKIFYEQNLKPDCSVVFAAFSNEERNMRGSRYFCDSNVIPIQNIKLNINFEMLGRTDEFGKNRYYVTGPNHSNFQDIIVNLNRNNDWEIADAGEIVDRLFRMSDNYIFVSYANSLNHCVPAHTVATSVGMSYVHQLHDEVEYIDFENMAGLVNNLTQLIFHIASKEVIVHCK